MTNDTPTPPKKNLQKKTWVNKEPFSDYTKQTCQKPLCKLLRIPFFSFWPVLILKKKQQLSLGKVLAPPKM